MSELIGLDRVALTPDGATLSMSVGPGQSLAIVAPAGAGKTAFLRMIAGIDRPAQGEVIRRADAALAVAESLSRRARPQSLVRRRAAVSAAMATEVLMATRLWDHRNDSLAELSPGQIAACELLELLACQAEILLIDGQLDRLDPWTLSGVLDRIGKLRAAGAAVVIATGRPDLVQRMDAAVVLRDRHIRFAGTIDDLVRTGATHTVTVSTQDRPGVRALVEPFEVSVQPSAEGWRFEAPEGQELAARLLLEGYGDVKFVVVRPPTVEEALLSLF